jgi:hypothetical protein
MNKVKQQLTTSPAVNLGKSNEYTDSNRTHYQIKPKSFSTVLLANILTN